MSRAAAGQRPGGSAADAGSPRAPRLGGLATATRDELLAELDWYDVSVTCELSGAPLCQLQVRGARFSSVPLVSSDLQGARLIDAAFDGCDLSGARFDEAALTRCEFRDCRLSGVQFNAARANDVRFVGCRLDGASFRMVHGERVWFEDCILTEAEFCAAELTRVRFERCDLTAADFSQARIPDADLRGSIVEGLRGVGGLQRPIIDAAQVVPFAYSLMALHGVVIRTEGDDE